MPKARVPVATTIPLVRCKGQQGSWVVNAGPPYGKIPVFYLTDFNGPIFGATVYLDSKKELFPESNKRSRALDGTWEEAMARAHYVALIMGAQLPRQYLGVCKVSKFVAPHGKTDGRLTIHGLVALDERVIVV
jgi:hypothetical protein